MTTPTPATDRDTLEQIAARLNLIEWDNDAIKLRAIASRLQPAPTVKESLTVADSVEKVAEDLDVWSSEWESMVVRENLRKIATRLRAIAAKQPPRDDAYVMVHQRAYKEGYMDARAKYEPKPSARAEEVAKKLEDWRKEYVGTGHGRPHLDPIIASVRSLQPSQPAMPPSVASLIDDLRAVTTAFDRQIAAVRADYAAAPAKGDDVRVVRVTHGVEWTDEPGSPHRIGTEEQCRKVCDQINEASGGDHKALCRLVRLEFGGQP